VSRGDPDLIISQQCCGYISESKEESKDDMMWRWKEEHAKKEEEWNMAKTEAE